MDYPCADVKYLIDAHFTSNYSYYKGVCYNYCKKSGIDYRDLLHDTYIGFLKIREEVIIKFHKLNRLYNIGLRVIRSLYQKKYNVKRNKNGSTNSLFALVNIYKCYEITDLYAKVFEYKEDVETFDTSYYKKLSGYLINDSENKYSEDDFLNLDKAVNELLCDPEKSTPVTIFLQANETSIYELHKNSGISRFYLTKEYEKGKEFLKQHINGTNVKSCRTEPGYIPVLDPA